MAEKFNARTQRKRDIENAIAIIANSFSMFGEKKNKETQFSKIDADVKALEADRAEFESDVEKDRYQSSIAQIRVNGAIADIGEELFKLLSVSGSLKNDILSLSEQISQYLVYSNSFKYIDDELLKWMLEKATVDKVEYVEFFAILIIIRNCYTGKNYEDIAKNYAYKALDPYIMEYLMEFDIEELCGYIACQKFWLIFVVGSGLPKYHRKPHKN